MSRKPLTLLVSPLDWGLGHATRMVPVIRRLRDDGHRVILAGSGRSAALLRSSFPGLEFHSLPSFTVRLDSRPPAFLRLALQLPAMVLSVFREHRRCRKLVQQFGVDIIVSDNRYGVYDRRAYSVLITHQLSPVLPKSLRWLEYPLCRLIYRLAGRFDSCWIPDHAAADASLSGLLSHRYPLPTHAVFIGPLSRFSGMDLSRQPGTKKGITVLISGPEPQAGRFEMRVRRLLEASGVPVVIVGGFRNGSAEMPSLPEGMQRVAHLNDTALASLLLSSEQIICRCGYSTIMDLCALGVQALLVPTPGQTEQLYLARRMQEKGWFETVAETRLSIPEPGGIKSVTGRPSVAADLAFLDGLYRKYEEHRHQSQQKS